jgi:transposase
MKGDDHMAEHYSSEYKMEVVKRIINTGETVTGVAQELGINKYTVQGWVRSYKINSEGAFPGSGNLSPEDERLKKLEKENRALKEEIEILKKAAAYFAKNQK